MSKTVRYVCLAMSALMLLQPASDALTLAPITLMMDRASKVVTLRVRNDEPRPIVLEARLFRWTQSGGQDVLTSATEIVVTPPIVQLAPNQELLVRIGIVSHDLARDTEQAYRLLLQDITPVAPGTNGLRLRLQYALPVFIPPLRRQDRIRVVQAKSAEHGACIAIRNDGNVHAKLVWTSGKDGEGIHFPAQTYILAGQQGLHCPDTPADSPSQLTAGITSAYQAQATSYEVLPSPE